MPEFGIDCVLLDILPKATHVWLVSRPNLSSAMHLTSRILEMDKEDADCGPLLEVMSNGQLFCLHTDSLWQAANQNWCNVLLRRDRVIAAIRSYRYMVDIADEAARTNCLEWSTSECFSFRRLHR